MRRFLQHPWRWLAWSGGAGLVAAVAVFVASGSQAADKAPAKLVVVEPLHQKGYTEKLSGSDVKFDMAPIPGGEYLMGSPASEPGHKPDEGPQHPVKILPFWMGKSSVTWDEYDQYWKDKEDADTSKETAADKAADAVSRPTPPYADETFGLGREGHPVICITHHAAMEYCRWLSIKTGKTYRLPTEAEWEWAARAGTTTPYFFGSDPKKLGDYAWYAANSEDETHEVGKKKPNPWGLYDIYGNAAQWCLDYYDKDFYRKFPLDTATLEPVLIPGNRRFSHVARGGGWSDDPAMCRSAARRASDKTWIKRDPQRPQSIWWLTDAEFVGFRIVRPVEELPKLKGLRSTVTKESK
ncbi:MAG TPA: formylglycine-generating enzyme family protein [Gemmataceae bacterium]|nr:formylglycine-generating enzyme family protein [Gemmataceae bacterium]